MDEAVWPSRVGRGGVGAQNATRVACVRSDAHPPVVWRMWLPAFCSLGFVKELRLKPWGG